MLSLQMVEVPGRCSLSLMVTVARHYCWSLKIAGFCSHYCWSLLLLRFFAYGGTRIVRHRKSRFTAIKTNDIVDCIFLSHINTFRPGLFMTRGQHSSPSILMFISRPFGELGVLVHSSLIKSTNCCLNCSIYLPSLSTSNSYNMKTLFVKLYFFLTITELY